MFIKKTSKRLSRYTASLTLVLSMSVPAAYADLSDLDFIGRVPTANLVERHDIVHSSGAFIEKNPKKNGVMNYMHTPVEGSRSILTYEINESDTITNSLIVRSTRKELEKNGFDITYECGELGNKCHQQAHYKMYDGNFKRTYWNKYREIKNLERNSGSIISAKRDDQHVVVLVSKLSNRLVKLGIDYIERKEANLFAMQPAVTAKALHDNLSKKGLAVLHGVLFKTNSSELLSESKTALNEIARFIKANPTKRYVLVGHTDAQGNYQSNLALSSERAKAVLRYISEEQKITTNRVAARGIAHLSPVASNTSPEGRAKNRRVELVEDTVQ